MRKIDLCLRTPDPDSDVLPEKSVLIFPWALAKERKLDKAYPFALFMIGKNLKYDHQEEPHSLGYWMWQDKDYHIDGKINLAGNLHSF